MVDAIKDGVYVHTSIKNGYGKVCTVGLGYRTGVNPEQKPDAQWGVWITVRKNEKGEGNLVGSALFVNFGDAYDCYEATTAMLTEAGKDNKIPSQQFLDIWEGMWNKGEVKNAG